MNKELEMIEAWRRDVSAEYVIRTGRAYPPAGTPAGQKLRQTLALLSKSSKNLLHPSDVVKGLIESGVLQG